MAHLHPVTVGRDLRASGRARRRSAVRTRRLPGTLVEVRKWWFGPMALLVVVVALGGCTSSDEGSDTARAAAPVPVGPGSHPPGTALLDGFVVPSGAMLIDGPLPFDDGPRSPNPDGPPFQSWQATMVVDGDPRPVIADLGRQAQRNGLVMQPADNYSEPRLPLSSYCRRDDTRYRCLAIGAVRDARTITPFDPLPPDQVRGFSVEFYRAPAHNGASAQTFLTLEYYADGDSAWGKANVTGAPDAPLGVKPPPVPTRWPALPQVGEPLEAGTHPHLVVEEGSTVLMPLLIDEEGWATTSVLRVEGHPQRVFDRYVDAARKLVPPTSPGTELDGGAPEETSRQASRLGAVTWTTVRGESRNMNVQYTLMLLERPDGPATIRIRAQCVPISYSYEPG